MASSPRFTITMEVDNESALPKMLEGRTIAALGGPLDNYTAEAREPARRHQIHDQLRLARQLRASLEEAADLADALPDRSSTSGPRSLAILQSALPQINRLVRLTEALKGKHAIDDPARYDEWNEWTVARNKEENSRRLREQRILRRQLREFAREKNPGLEIDEDLEARHDALISREKSPEEAERGGDDEEEGENDEAAGAISAAVPNAKTDTKTTPGTSEFNAGPESGAAIRDAGADTVNSDEDDDLPVVNLGTKSAGKHSKSGRTSELKKRSHNLLSRASSALSSTKESRAAGKAEKDGSEPGRGSAKAARKGPPEMAKAAPKAKRPPLKAERTQSPVPRDERKPSNKASQAPGARPPKRCHNCKMVTTRYRGCNYWKLTGKQCRKNYCVACLMSEYSLGDDVQSASNPDGIPLNDVVADPAFDAEWHCPRCLAEAEEDKSRAIAAGGTGGRRSGRRSAGNSSSFFY